MLFIIRHIFYNCHTRYIHTIEHFNASFHIHKTQLLRSRHNHSSCHIQLLTQSQLNIPRTRRHVQNQIIQLTPMRQPKKLIQQLRHHRPTHNSTAFIHKPKTHQLHISMTQRSNLRTHKLNIFTIRRHHSRQRRTVHIHIKYPNLGTQLRKSKRQIHRRRTFSYATLTTTHRNNIRHLIQTRSLRLTHSHFLSRHTYLSRIHKIQIHDKRTSLIFKLLFNGTRRCCQLNFKG
mmetsp:Transcript_12160/g.15885  ORF Transcript_12160/g.15885 Transcript_12160/m.15885 type:complete len:232 (-) Transcript_12160:63-758(-)